MNKKYLIIFSLIVSFVVLLPNPIAVQREDNFYFESEEVNITVLDKDLLYLEGTYNFRCNQNDYPEILIIDYPFVVVGNEPLIKSITLEGKVIYNNTNISDNLISYQTNLEDIRQQENDSHKFMLLNDKYFKDVTKKTLAAISVRKKDISFSNYEGKVYKQRSLGSGYVPYSLTQEYDNKIKLHKTDSISEYYIRLPLDFTNPEKKNATLKIDFYQQYYSNQYIYILQSSQSWSTSLSEAIFTVSLDDNYDLESNYEDFINEYELADGKKKYICNLTQFGVFPTSDLLLSWK